MPDPAAPAWATHAPLGAERWRLVRITRRGVGMTLATAVFWLAMAAVAAFAGLDAGMLGTFFAVGALLVYPGGYAWNRVLGGDLTARGSGLRGLVAAITAAQLLGAPVVIAVLLHDPARLAFVLATLLGAHFLPYGWLYHAPAYTVLAVASAVIAATVQGLAADAANVAIPLAMAALYLVTGVRLALHTRRELAAHPAR